MGRRARLDVRARRQRAHDWRGDGRRLVDPAHNLHYIEVATGRAYTVNDPGQVLRYERLLHPWVNHADTVLAIDPDVVTGFHIIANTTLNP